MWPPCLGESLKSWTRPGPCQTPSGGDTPRWIQSGWQRSHSALCPPFKGWYQLQSRGAFSTSLFPERRSLLPGMFMGTCSLLINFA